MKQNKPEDLFRAEKERALTVRNSQHARLLAEAKAAFDKLMAEGQAARKSGRPRKHPLPPLKTSSSSRLPVKPPTPASALRPVSPAPVPAPPPAAPPAVKAEKPPAAQAHAPAKRPAPAKSAAPAKKAAKAAPKSKAKAKTKKR